MLEVITTASVLYELKNNTLWCLWNFHNVKIYAIYLLD